MKTTDFKSQAVSAVLKSGSFRWKAPSNIALVKYWGKSEGQIPKNTSISFTLEACSTYTKLSFKPRKEKESFEIKVLYEGKAKDDFRPKIVQFFKRIAPYVSFVREYSYVIDTRNTFPHSSGIASSASGMAALALCIMSMEKELNPDMSAEYFYQKASFLARLGSGSAARSVQGPLVIWGKHPLYKESTDLYGVVFPDDIHPVFKHFHDTILLVDKGQKKVSSSVGHALMQNHPFAGQRFKQAQTNVQVLSKALREGNMDGFIQVVEAEALSLHAMMLTSTPNYLLMQPQTLAIIQSIRKYREETGIPVLFTLDAGANVHLLYPEHTKLKVDGFIKKDLLKYCENGQYINDRVGMGAVQLL